MFHFQRTICQGKSSIGYRHLRTKREGKKKTAAFCWTDFMYIWAFTHLGMYSLHTQHVSITDFLSCCHRQYCLCGIVCYTTQHTLQPLTNNTRYYNKCNLSCALLTFPFFNCMFSFFQLCIIDLRWRLQRKEKVYNAYYIRLTHPILTKKSKNDNFFSIFYLHCWQFIPYTSKTHSFYNSRICF